MENIAGLSDDMLDDVSGGTRNAVGQFVTLCCSCRSAMIFKSVTPAGKWLYVCSNNSNHTLEV